MATDLDYIETRGGFNLGTLFLGILIGAVAGGVVALLFAPKTGPETRALLRGKATETQQMLQSRANDISERVGKIRSGLRSSAEKQSQTPSSQ